MRLGLWCLWCLWCLWSSWIFSVHGAAEHHPGRADGAGGRVGGRRAAVDGRLCGVRCCVGRTSSPKARRCLKSTVRCPHHCRSNPSCQQFSSCILGTSTGPVRDHVTGPERGVSSPEQVRRTANEVPPLLGWTGSSGEVWDEGPRRPGSGPHPATAEKKQNLSLREAQALLMRKTLAKGGGGDKMAAALMKHIEKEKKKLWSVMSSEGGRLDRRPSPTVVCPLLCQNGGVCLQTDRCLCPPTFTGKFCHIPITMTPATPPSTNDIASHSEFLMPLGSHPEGASAGALSPSMVKVRVQHPPEASVKIHQVLKISGPGPAPALQALVASTSSGSAGAPAPAGGALQTWRGGGAPQRSEFKYCFREVKDGQCSSPLPGLRSKDMCCRGIGKAWGITSCVLCPQNTGQNNNSCPAGFQRTNQTHCADVNECLLPGLCDNGLCVNTRGSYSCVCRAGFILDASHGICVSQAVISEEKGQCFRVLGSGLGPASCSLPILRNITKQICCCSRVGKAWGAACLRCPYFGSAAFKELCPAGPGYQYSASAQQFNQRVSEQLGRHGALLVTHGNDNNHGPGPGSGSSSGGVSRTRQSPPSSGGSTSSATAGAGSGPGSRTGVGAGSGADGASSSRTPHTRTSSPGPPLLPGPVNPPSSRVQSGTTAHQDKAQGLVRPGTREVQPELGHPKPGPQTPPASPQGNRSLPVVRSDQPAAPAAVQPQSLDRGSRPSAAASPTSRAQTRSVCEILPGVCGRGRGRCVDLPGGKHTCVCEKGYQPNTQQTYCQDVNECGQSPAVCPVGQCVNAIGSYRCVCPSGYQSVSPHTSCHDMDECQFGPCVDGRCENVPGSYRCLCRHGYRLSGNKCTDVDECVDPLQCPGQECVNSPGSYRCVSCQPGYRLLNRLCTDINECRLAPCTNGRCENTPGSYRCVCRHGYRLQNDTCTDVDECADPSQCPGQMCVNTVGSYRCVSCRPGYTLINRRCADVDECEAGGACPGQLCVNTEGSFSCVSCQHGYHTVNGVCSDVDECAQVSQCPGQQCVNTVGSYRCVSCQPGYSIQDGSCQDVDECVVVGVCGQDRECVNTVGSFRCECRHGYRASNLGRQCRDIDECVEAGVCSRGKCVNSPGSYTCVCSQGFRLNDNKTDCEDVDECVKVGVCADGRCVNTPGSFQCRCEGGFTPNPEKTACLDVDECVSSAGLVCGSRRCENTIGSYRCHTSCDPGYQVALSGSCVDVNECANETLCGAHAFCENLAGTYRCVCDRGFTSSADGKACEDEDECVSLSGVCGSARCENVEGSFMCECDRTGYEFDASRRECVRTHTSSSQAPPPLPPARPGEVRECYHHLAEGGGCSLLAANSSQQECCCTVGEGWGLGCRYHTCPSVDSADFLSLCPSGRGYVSGGPGGFGYTDVDECQLFHPNVCKNGVCVNNVPGYSCYCTSGYVYNSSLLECVDHDECEEESCVGGACVNTLGSYYCSCLPPLVLDDAQRTCVNSSHLAVDESLSVCWQQVGADMLCQGLLLGPRVTFMSCCCVYGEGWGMHCALCPPPDSDDYIALCGSFDQSPPLDSFPDAAAPPPGAGAPPYLPPYGPDSFPPVAPGPDYDDYSPAGGSRPGFRPDYSIGFYPDFGSPDGSPIRDPSLHLPLGAEGGFGAWPPPRGSQPDGAPLPQRPYQEEEEEEEEEEVSWRPAPPFRSRGGAPQRLYERRYEPYGRMSTTEDCGILHGCENGRCIRVSEGYTCDCYHGYQLDMTSMACVDVDECEDGAEQPCVNARCINTPGSFRCVCWRGFVMTEPNRCLAA